MTTHRCRFCHHWMRDEFDRITPHMAKVCSKLTEIESAKSMERVIIATRQEHSCEHFYERAEMASWACATAEVNAEAFMRKIYRELTGKEWGEQ